MSRTRHQRRPRRTTPGPTQRPVKSRLVGYTLRGAFCERDVEDYLARAKTTRVVVDFGADAYDDSGAVWFNGMPGPALREGSDAV